MLRVLRRLLAPLVVWSGFAEQLPVTVFSLREGLPTTVVPRIVVDSKGFVWMPGSAGLARFDGNSFRLFKQSDGLPTSAAADILERQDGTYWVASQQQVCLFDPRANARRFQCDSPNAGLVNTLLEDEQGLWCGADSGLLRRARGSTKWESVAAIVPTAPQRSIAVGRLIKDSRGDVWAATYSGLYRFRRHGRVDRWTVADGLASDSVITVSETPNAIWAGTQTELTQLRIDARTGEAQINNRYSKTHGLPSGYATDVRFWRGHTWAATFQGLGRQLPSGRWEPMRFGVELGELSLESMAIDALGNLWLGTNGYGAIRISGTGFSSLTESEGLGARKVWAVFENQQGELIAVTKSEDHYALNRFDGHRFHPIRPGGTCPIQFGWSWSQIAVHSRAGEWWLGTGGGLLRYRSGLRAPPVRLGPEQGIVIGNIARIFEDSTGAIWASRRAVSNHSLFRLRPGARQFESFDESHGLPSLRQDANFPSTFAEDRAGHVWIGMNDGGLVRFREGKFELFPARTGVPAQGVRALLVDRKGRLWIGSRGQGVVCADDPAAPQPVFTSVASRELAGKAVSALTEDLFGRIYAASGHGVDRIDPRVPSGPGRIRSFTTADGLPPGDLRAAFRDRQGALWFGGDQGLIRLQPREENTEPPPVLFYSIVVSGRRQPLSDVGDAEPARLSLSPEQRELQVEFGGFRHDLLYQTMLSGVDRGWTPPSSARSVHYLSLAPGTYELAIRALSPQGAVSDRPARLRFRIAAPVWQRWWFLLITATTLFAMFYAIHRSRVAQAVALERVRTRIASDLHDDIGSSLTHVAILSELAGQRVEAQQGDVRGPLTEIERVSRELVDSMSDTVWAIDPRKDSLRDLAQRMRRWASDVLTGRNIEVRFHVPDEDLALDAEMRRELFLVFKEAVHNVVRHSGCTQASIDLTHKDESLVLEVSDNGKGFEAGNEAPGHGLGSMKRRAARLGGEMQIRSNGIGVTVVLRVPLRARRRTVRTT